MKIRYLLSVLLMLPIGLFATGNVHSHKDNLGKRFITSPVKPDFNYQSQLRNEHSWKQFTAINGDWWVQFNESNGLPHRAMGKPISIPVTSSPEQAASYFLHNMAGMFLPDNINLKFVGSTTNNKHYQPNFIQYYQGKEVLFSRATVKMSKNYKAIMFGLDVYSDIQLPNKEMINAESAASAASSDVDHVTKINVNPDLKILPVPSYRNNIYHLVYEVTVSTLEENIPALYYTLVDANTGAILYRQNKINHINTDVTMSGTVYPTNVYNPSQVKPLQYVRMNIGGVNYNADVNGQFQNIVLPASISATFYLEGPWAKVYTGASGSTLSTMTSTLNIGTNTLSFDNNTNIRHRSAYYHTNIVHDFMKSKLSFFTDLDFPMIVKVDRTDGTCNAFYDGNLNFYTTAGGCNALSQVDDVIYHEYGHGITNVFWASNGLNFSNGAMGEGYSDIWAISITGNPVLGIGFDDTDPTVYIRNYDFNNSVPRKIYPQNIVGQVHSDGEIIAGAWYTLALNLNSLSQMADLFAATHSGLANGPDGAEGQVYTDILIDALEEDDNDFDITNGTPNGNAITSAFAAHGITLLSNVNLTHSPVLTAATQSPITLNATVSASQFFWALSAVKGAYKINNSGPWIPFSMTPAGSQAYTTTIPAQPAGTIISYYLGIEDTYGNMSNVQPAAAEVASNPNLPYFVMVGYNLLFTDDFDNNAGFWITGLPGDNATTGMWEQNEPQATIQGSTVVQPGFQNTPGGTYCYVTQADPGSGLGSFDIDGGKTTIQTPTLDMSAMTNPAIEYFRWYTNDQGSTPGTDFWQVYISNDGVNYVPVENTPTSDHSWRRFAFRVTDYVTLTNTVTVRFVAEDANDGSLVEALMDDFSVYESATSGIAENTTVVNATLAPNPAQDQIQLNCVLAISQNFTLQVNDATGRNVYSDVISMNSGINQYKLPVDKLSNGVYHLSLKNEKGLKSLRFVVSH